MARELGQILQELNSVYDPQRGLYQKQIEGLDPQLEAENQGLESQKRDSFQQITDQANRRDLFYSGRPVAEEQRYVGSQFLPAVANLRAKYSSQKFGLQDAIAKITADQYNQAYGVRQKELDTEEQKRQFDAQLAAQEAASRRSAAAASGAGGFSPSFGGRATTSRNSAAPTADPIAAARAFAEQLKSAYFSTGKVDPYYRESVLNTLKGRYGDSPAISDIVYKQVFNDGWDRDYRANGSQLAPAEKNKPGAWVNGKFYPETAPIKPTRKGVFF